MISSKSNSIEQKIGHLLVDWFKKNRRELPWRNYSSLYYRLVSEFMLQQTQVVTVIPYFNRWIDRFPSIEELARAPEDEVLKAWEGLGYYSRAKNLHHTAKLILKQQMANPGLLNFPQTPEEWLQFPGIGEYTANAIASIAQNQHVAAIDGNVIRVLCRLNGFRQIFENKKQAVSEIKNIANFYIPAGKSADYNEAIMEFGALICKPKNPLCNDCFITKYCNTFQEQLNSAQIPQFQRIASAKKIIRRVLLCDSKSIILKKTNTKRLHNIFEIPLIEDMVDKMILYKIAQINRSIAREYITEFIFQPKFLPEDFKNLPQKNPILVLLSLYELKNITLSGPHRKWIDKKISSP